MQTPSPGFVRAVYTAFLALLAGVAGSGPVAAQNLDDPEAHCAGYNDEAVSGFGGYQQPGDHGYAVIPGFTFGCTTRDGATGNRVRVKPKFCNVDGGRFPMPSGRAACHLMVEDAINNGCKANALATDPGIEFFSSSDAVARFAGCLPIFREQARACVAHFTLMRPRCGSGEPGAEQPGREAGRQRAAAPEPNCAGAQAGANCWKETANQPGCYVWDDYLSPGQTVEWSGSCPDGIAAGQGTLSWSSDDGPIEVKGTLSDSKRQGHWVIRSASGSVWEGPYVDGKEHGRWVWRLADGSVWEGPYVDGKQHGRWVERGADGNVREWTYVNGELQSYD